MTLDQYIDQWAQDAAMDLDTLDESARNIPILHAKWWRFYSHERLRFKKFDADYKSLHRQKWEYFLGKMDDEERKQLGWPALPLKILAQNVSVYLDADPDLQALVLKKTYLEELLRFMEDVIKQINNRNFVIKSTIDFLRFKSGI